jgi:flagellar biosynthesis protein FliQ
MEAKMIFIPKIIVACLLVHFGHPYIGVTVALFQFTVGKYKG